MDSTFNMRRMPCRFHPRELAYNCSMRRTAALAIRGSWRRPFRQTHLGMIVLRPSELQCHASASDRGLSVLWVATGEDRSPRPRPLRALKVWHTAKHGAQTILAASSTRTERPRRRILYSDVIPKHPTGRQLHRISRTRRPAHPHPHPP